MHTTPLVAAGAPWTQVREIHLIVHEGVVVDAMEVVILTIVVSSMVVVDVDLNTVDVDLTQVATVLLHVYKI